LKAPQQADKGAFGFRLQTPTSNSGFNPKNKALIVDIKAVLNFYDIAWVNPTKAVIGFGIGTEAICRGVAASELKGEFVAAARQTTI